MQRLALPVAVVAVLAFAAWRLWPRQYATDEGVSLDAGQGSDTPDASADGTFLPQWASDAAQSVSETVTSIKNTVTHVLQSGAGFNVLQLSDGTVVRQQGARNWRNNNPGNIEYGPFAIAHGAIGSDGRFAIFPDYDTGRAAKAALIFDGANYRDLTLSRAIARYAPPTENDTLGYQRAVLAAVGGLDQRMADYTPAQRSAILDAMERQEGFKVGSVTVVNPEA